jgi:hypothetical protein
MCFACSAASSVNSPSRLLSLSVLPFYICIILHCTSSSYSFTSWFEASDEASSCREGAGLQGGVWIFLHFSVSVCCNEPNLWGVQKWQCKERSKPSTIPLVITIPQLGTCRLPPQFYAFCLVNGIFLSVSVSYSSSLWQISSVDDISNTL